MKYIFWEEDCIKFSYTNYVMQGVNDYLPASDYYRSYRVYDTIGMTRNVKVKYMLATIEFFNYTNKKESVAQ